MMGKRNLHREMINQMHAWSTSGNGWGSSLRESCLPVCIGTIRHLKSLDSGASIVIGDIAKTTLGNSHTNKIKDYSFNWRCCLNQLNLFRVLRSDPL